MSKLAFIVHTCDRYDFVWSDCLKYLQWFYNFSYPIYFVNEEKSISLPTLKSKSINYYTEYKKLAETLVEEVCKSYLIIRLPNLLGKGICSRFKEEKDILAIGQIELLTIDDAIKLIINNIKYNSNSIVELQGTNIDASLLQNIIKFGSK